jgi:hypothetical protein
MSALALVLALALQDDATIAEWVRQLGDDAVDVREQAAAGLARAGRAAEARLRQALKSPNEEVRARAAQLLADLDRADRRREFDRGPSRITLRRDRAPLREILEEIRKQTPTRVEFSEAPVADPVTFAVEGEPLFRALDALCRAHGGLALSVESRRGDNVIATLSAGTPSKRPHCFKDQYLFVLDSVRTTTAFDLAGGSSSRMGLAFRWAWEKGTRPLTASLRIRDVVDGSGKSYAAELPEEEAVRLDLWRSDAAVAATVTLPFAPPAAVDRLSAVRGDLELSFPEGEMAVVFENPQEKPGQERRGGEGSVKLVTFGREGGRVRARIEVRPPELVSRLEAKAAGKDGKEYPGRKPTVVVGDEEPLTVDFTVPAGAEVTALRFWAPTGFREKKVPFEFRDLRIR